MNLHNSYRNIHALTWASALIVLGGCVSPPPMRMTAPTPPTESGTAPSPSVASTPSTSDTARLRLSVRLKKSPADTVSATPGTPSTSAPPATPATDTAQDRAVYFVPGQDQISAEGKRMLQSLGARAKENRRLTITLIGHTDDTGSTEFDIAKAQRRVDMVATELQRQGASARQIRRISHGSESVLISKCSDEQCKWLHRRVDLTVDE